MDSTLMAWPRSVFTAPALEWRIDAHRWPARAVRRDGQPVGALVLSIGLAWLALALRDLAAGESPIADLGGGWLSLTIGAALALWGGLILMRRQTIRIDHDGVHVRIQHMIGVTVWREPLACYRGVVWHSEPIRRREVQLVELVHEDPDKTVTLFSSTARHAAEEAWHAWAQRLGLAAIRRTDAASVPGARDAQLAGRQEAHGA